jgi:hypothetical protein
MESDKHITTCRQELKVVGVLLIFVLFLELAARVIAPHLDYDRMHISKFEKILAEMPAEDKREAKHLCVLGNSLLMHGFDADLFEHRMANVQVTKLTPVGTGIHDWDMIFKRYLEDTESLPRNLLIGFVAHHIDDSEPIKLRRMARHFAAAGDLPYLWENEDFDFHQKMQSVLSHYSALAGDQPEYRLRTLDFLIPEYRDGLNANKDFASQSEIKDSPVTEHKSSFERMIRFLESCKRCGVQVYLVPMPQPEIWELDPEIGKIAERFGAKILDARSIRGMGEKDFPDGYHLGETGVEKFTNWLSDEFVRLGIYDDE